ncbi:MAG TPA: CHC2 zinc finger domain-containing protein, partial [Burkholderiales bacterium]|nr:CHC2 zinc finger domain-containing protein [Burkholderiales bacterium]
MLTASSSFADRDALTASIRAHADLFTLVQEDTGDRIRGRGNERRGPCPIHGGERPNFTVNVNEGVFHCFTCGAGGDVFDYVRATRGLDFPAARAFLAQRLGLSLDASAGRPLRLQRPPAVRRRSPGQEQRDGWTAELESLRTEGCMPCSPATVYAAVLQNLTLEDVGAA